MDVILVSAASAAYNQEDTTQHEGEGDLIEMEKIPPTDEI